MSSDCDILSDSLIYLEDIDINIFIEQLEQLSQI